MSRRAAPPAAALALLTCVSGVSLLAGTTPAPAGGPSRPGGLGSAAGAPAAGDVSRHPQRAWRQALDRRLTDARRDTVDLAPVVGGDDRPNIVVLMLDDMRDDDLRYMPNVQRLVADQGVRFTNSFSPHPLCCPARASFVTGLYSHNHEVWSHVPPYGFRVLDDSDTLPVWLQGMGYRTTFLGKYLNGYGRQPTLDGRDSMHYVPPGWTDWRGSVDDRTPGGGHLSGGTYRYFDTTLSVNGRLEAHPGVFQTHLFSGITQDMIRDAARSPRPLFSWISFTTPHSGSPREKDDPRPVKRRDGSIQYFGNPARPQYVKGRFDRLITDIPAPDDAGADHVAEKPSFIRTRPPLEPAEEAAVLENYRQRVEAMSVVDDEVANIVDALRRTGELDNTYLAVTSDNGFFLGEHRMRQGKILPYEPSLRVPLVIRGPGIPAGEVRSDSITTIDLAPTLLDAAGGSPRPLLDGTSLLDVAEHGDLGWTRGILTETGPRVVNRDVKESDNFLVQGTRSWRLRFSVGLRTGRYLYVDHATGERELYDLRTDPRQLDNVAGDPEYARVQQLLQRHLGLLRNCAGVSCRIPLPAALRTRDPAPAGIAVPPGRS